MKLGVNLTWKGTLLGLWVVFSICYIAFDVYSAVRYGLMATSYQQGQKDTILAIISGASDKECKTVPLFAGDQKVNLVNVDCLKQAPAEESTPAKK